MSTCPSTPAPSPAPTVDTAFCPVCWLLVIETETAPEMEAEIALAQSKQVSTLLTKVDPTGEDCVVSPLCD